MTFLNASIPHIYCLLRREFLYDQQRGHGEYERCAIFGVTSIQSRALMFLAMTERGAQIDRLPISAFAWQPCEPLPLGHLQLWDAFSYHVAVTEFDFLRGLACWYLSKGRRWYRGRYVMTFDWAHSAYAEDPGEGGHKSGHLLRLETGHYAIAPNNRIFWREGSFITRPLVPGKDRPDYLTNTHVWQGEDGHRWAAEDSPAMFYGDQDLEEKR